MKLLLVEDNPADARLIREMLKDSPAGEFQVQHVPRLDSAVQLLRRETLDAVLLDLALPDSEGLRTLAVMQRAGGGLPIVVLTGLDDECFAFEAVRAGAQDYLIKGRFDSELLVRTIRYAVQRNRAEKTILRLNADLERRVAERTAQLQAANDELLNEIAERKRAEERQHQLAQQRQLALDAARLGWWHYDPVSRISTWDSRYKEIFGVAEYQRPMDEINARMHPDDLPRVSAAVAASLDPADGRPYAAEYRIFHDDGSVRWVEAHGLASFEGQGDARHATSLVGTVQDITERRQAEQALIRTEKLASVGRLAATIAHEVNNPLAAATNAVYIASADPDLSEQTRDVLQLADQELRRAAHITGQTLGFVRETNSRNPVALPELIDEVLRVYARKLRDRGVTVQRRYKCGPCRQECEACFIANAGELRQIIFNLLVNGMDALRDNGTLHVRLCRIAGFGSGPKIRLTIADNGCGIRAENLKRVFEPFFTTKESVGTGLGLWISQEIVRKYQGSIRMRSQKEKGTVFCITVPAMPLPPTSERGPAARNRLSA
jgi:two-component system, cell cycle sensor histidine kinase and response regulator CckA